MDRDSKTERGAGGLRRLGIRRALWGLLASVAAMQAMVIAALSVVALRRRLLTQRKTFVHELPAPVPVGENSLQIYTFGQDLFDAMIAAIDEARESIYLETFIWKSGETGQRFKDHLAAKAREGVKVYVIFDSFGNLVVSPGFKIFPTEMHVLKFWALRRPWHILDPRRYAVDHRKLLVVDGRIGFIGGYNIGSVYATEWRDTHLRIVGPAAADLAQSFVDFWNRFCPRLEQIKHHYAQQFDPLISILGNDTMRLTFPIRDMYIDAIDRAQSRIRLTNAYFIPDHTLLGALKAAARRGVDVQVLLPWVSNHVLADWVSRGYFAECLEAGIKLLGYRGAMIHAKTCTIDGEWSTIGTANLDRLSAIGNYEVNARIFSPELAAEMEAIFDRDKTDSFELTKKRWRSRPWYVKLSERVLVPFRLVV